eukprot:2550371-Rhodomonas_salina.1
MRVKPLINTGERRRTVAQTWCARSFHEKVSKKSLIDRYVDDLFPVAQGVRGSMGVETCTRYAIELARQGIFKMLNVQDAETQYADVKVWQRR